MVTKEWGCGVMKRLIVIAFTLAGLLGCGFFCGCMSDAKAPDLGVSCLGNQMTITLEENPTTGYSWVSVIKGSAVEADRDSYYPKENADRKAGTGGVHSFIYVGQHGGSAQILLTYGQQWEGGLKDRTLVFDVTVDAQGDITKAEQRP